MGLAKESRTLELSSTETVAVLQQSLEAAQEELVQLQGELRREREKRLPEAVAVAASALVKTGGVLRVRPLADGGFQLEAPLLVGLETVASLIPGDHHPRTIRRIADQIGTPIQYVGKTPSINPRRLVRDIEVA
jgi:hypothetical protein